MERKQFYPDEALAKCLDEDSKNRGISESLLIVDILEEYYGLKSKEEPSLTELTKTVLDEVEEYVKGLAVGAQFDLLSASSTYEKICMTSFYYKKRTPKFARASIGRSFASKIGKDRFSNVRKAMKLDKKGNDKQVLSANNALVYEKIDDNTDLQGEN